MSLLNINVFDNEQPIRETNKTVPSIKTLNESQ